MQKLNKLTIVLIVNDVSEYFDVTIGSIIEQTNQNFDVIIVDKFHKTEFTDVKTVTNENYAISECKTDYIYFITDKDILDLNFVERFTRLSRMNPSEIYQFNYENVSFTNKNEYSSKITGNISLNHSIENKVFNTKFLRSNYFGFNLSKYEFNLEYVMFFYTVMAHCKVYYTSKKICCRHYGSVFKASDYYQEYAKLLDDLKRFTAISKYESSTDITRYIKYEDSKQVLLLNYLENKSLTLS